MVRDTKQRLLDKGLEILMHKGYNHTGIQEVLQSVGVPKGSFYHYFKSKHDFGLQILEHYTAKSSQETAEILTDPEQEPLQRIRNFFAAGRAHFEECGYSGGCFIGNLAQEMGDLCPRFQEVLEDKFEAQRQHFLNCLVEARDNGQLDRSVNCEDMADFLINSWQGALMRMKVAKSPRSLDIFTSTVFEKLVA